MKSPWGIFFCALRSHAQFSLPQYVTFYRAKPYLSPAERLPFATQNHTSCAAAPCLAFALACSLCGQGCAFGRASVFYSDNSTVFGAGKSVLSAEWGLGRGYATFVLMVAATEVGNTLPLSRGYAALEVMEFFIAQLFTKGFSVASHVSAYGGGNYGWQCAPAFA